MATGNVAKNDITGQYIKSRPPTKDWNNNYDRAFTKKTAQEWAALDGIEILGSETEKISYKQFTETYL